MVIVLGHYALALALGTTVGQVLLSIYGVFSKNALGIALGVRAAVVSFCLISFSLGALMLGFLHNDFSVQYIALHSNAYLPWYYKVSALWSGHEGSLLLWVWVLALWTFGVARKAVLLPVLFRGRLFTVLGIIAVGFLSLILLTSNPFLRWLPIEKKGGFPLIGKDLNPLLQDIGLIFHPPLLYMGYVGFSVAFAFIVAALWCGRLDTQWARWVRPWVAAAWAFLTVGIALGSWWAYYELGWGGWWFWDPVENASLMPWLASVALLHSLSATEKRDVFKVWTAFLAITTFSLSLLGTFLVRSGILTSVHAFASDPTRGLAILIWLGVIVGTAFVLLMVRSPALRSSGRFAWVSREMSLLINNVLLSIACLVVFVGTLAPLFYDVMGWARISVGAAYFNTKMLWVLILVLVFLTFAPYLQWKHDRLPRLWRSLSWATLLGVSGSYMLNCLFDPINWQAVFLLALVMIALLTAMFDAYRHSMYRGRFPSRGYLAMCIAHVGFLLCCGGIILTGSYSQQKDVYLRMDDSVSVAGYQFLMKSLSRYETKLYSADKIDFLVRDQSGQVLTMMSPEKRYYTISQMPMAEVALSPSLRRDLYIALGERQNTTDHKSAWSVRLQVKPFIRWIWLGALIMALSAWFIWGNNRYTKAD